MNVARSGEDLVSGPIYRLRIGDVGLYGKDALTNLGSLLLCDGSVDIDDRDDCARMSQTAGNRFFRSRSPRQ